MGGRECCCRRRRRQIDGSLGGKLSHSNDDFGICVCFVSNVHNTAII